MKKLIPMFQQMLVCGKTDNIAIADAGIESVGEVQEDVLVSSEVCALGGVLVESAACIRSRGGDQGECGSGERRIRSYWDGGGLSIGGFGVCGSRKCRVGSYWDGGGLNNGSFGGRGAATWGRVCES